MISNEADFENEGKYSVVTVEKTPPPEGMTGDNWYQYIIGYGISRMVGKKPGTLTTVTSHAETVAEQLNERAGSGGSIYAGRHKK